MPKNLPSVVICFLMLAVSLCGAVVNFDPSNPSIGPFPTDYLTTRNLTQKTGLSVNLPLPDCTAQPSACTQASLLNELDGFHLQPRIRVRFSDAIDISTLKAGIFFVRLDNLTADEKGLGFNGRFTAINQVIYDPATNTAYAKPNDFFDRHRRYVLLVTDAVLDSAGQPVTPDPKFTACVQSPQNDYCNLLQQAVRQTGGAGLPRKVVAASVFTTMSPTAWLEMARDLLPRVPFGFQSMGAPVKTAGITSITLKAQVGVNTPAFQNFSFSTAAGTLAGLDRIVFGTYQSPNFLTTGQFIPSAPTATALTLPSANSTIAFHAYIPSSPMPAAGLVGRNETDVHLTLWPGGERKRIATSGYHGRNVTITA